MKTRAAAKAHGHDVVKGKCRACGAAVPPVAVSGGPVMAAIGRAIAEYTGKRVVEVDYLPDPQVRGVFAIQARVAGGGGQAYQFLVRGVRLEMVGAGDLEECTFTCWPPVSAL